MQFVGIQALPFPFVPETHGRETPEFVGILEEIFFQAVGLVPGVMTLN
jgi:hypothetical protein